MRCKGAWPNCGGPCEHDAVVTLDSSLAGLAPTCRIIPHYRDLGAVYLNLTDMPAPDERLAGPLKGLKAGDLKLANQLLGPVDQFEGAATLVAGAIALQAGHTE